MTKEKTLMYVRDVSDEDNGVSISCEGYENLGVGFFLQVPYDIGRKLKGRQLWVSGGFGEKCVIWKWVDLPTEP